MSSTSEAMLINQQGLFEDEEMSTQMGYFPFFSNNPTILPLTAAMSTPPPPPPLVGGGADTSTTVLTQTLLSSATPKQKQDFISHLGAALPGPQIFSLQTSNSNLWAWGEVNDCMGIKRRNGDGDGDGDDDHHHHHHLGVVSTMKMKKIKARRNVREPRFCFKTMSDVDVLDDGYKWRKYGQKVVKNTQHPRSYYRCTQEKCRVKKRVERLAEDPRMVITTYEGRHPHSPSHDDHDDSQTSSLLNHFF